MGWGVGCREGWWAAAHYLVPKDSDGAGSGDLMGAKPDRGDARGHAQDEDLGQGADDLPQDGDGEEVRLQAAQLHPSTQGIEGRASQSYEAQAPPVQQPGNREEEGYVGEHVAHGKPVDGKGAHTIEMHQDVADAAVLDPLESVAQGVAAEEQHHDPATTGQSHLGGGGSSRLLRRRQPRRPGRILLHHASSADRPARLPAASHLAGKCHPRQAHGCHLARTQRHARPRPPGPSLSSAPPRPVEGAGRGASARGRGAAGWAPCRGVGGAVRGVGPAEMPPHHSKGAATPSPRPESIHHCQALPPCREEGPVPERLQYLTKGVWRTWTGPEQCTGATCLGVGGGGA